MEVKNILPLFLILMFVTVVMRDIQPVHATPYEYELYVDDFKPWVSQWAVSGTSPWLNATDNNYIEGTFHGAWMANFTFEDITLPPCEVITKVVLEGYTNGPYNLTVDYDVYTLPDFVWLGSLYATGAPAWVTRRWYPTWTVDKVYPAALTEAGLNNLEVMLYFFDPYGSGGAGNTIDALRLKVYTAISAIIDFDPDVVKLSSNAPYMTCYITLSCGFSASDIDQSTILLDGIISPVWCDTPTDSSLMVKFDMPTVKNHIVNYHLGGTPPPPNTLVPVELTVTFSLNIGIPFEGSDTIGVRSCPKH